DVGEELENLPRGNPSIDHQLHQLQDAGDQKNECEDPEPEKERNHELLEDVPIEGLHGAAMVMKRRRQVNARRPGPSGGRWLYGLHPLEEHLRRAPEQFREIWLATPLGSAREELARAATAAGVSVHRVASEHVERLCPGEPHQ